jgi:predicted 2-oxoglutarate/Fe(II)-dependent dioxygenase YbiX
MVKIIKNVLNDDDLDYCYNFCNSVSDLELDGMEKEKNSQYKKKVIILSNSIKYKIFSILKENYGLKCKMRNNWINIIKPGTNDNDGFHHDVSDASLIIYLNDDYQGGTFEYLDSNGETKIIKPVKNMGILLSKNILHRVKPVIMGRRYSLISFFYIDDDFVKQKSII